MKVYGIGYTEDTGHDDVIPEGTILYTDLEKVKSIFKAEVEARGGQLSEDGMSQVKSVYSWNGNMIIEFEVSMDNVED